MRALVNIRHLERDVVYLEDELTVEELDINTLDEVIHVNEPLSYELEAQEVENGMLVQGTIHLTLDCECVRCLAPFKHRLNFDNWICHLDFLGDDKDAIVNDVVDLTPYIREDIVLALPQHPLCKRECQGLSNPAQPQSNHGTRDSVSTSSAWAELNKLKLNSD